MTRVAIWGSCVTRDAFEIRPHAFDEITYFARTSWVAQAAPDPGIEPAIGPDLAGKFGERMVREDLGRLVVPRLIAAAPDLVVLDLIDERFDLLDVGGGAWVTESDYFLKTETHAAITRPATPRDRLLGPDRAARFESAAAALAPVIRQALPGVPVMLHASFYTPVVDDPEVALFQGAGRHAAITNRALARCGASLQRHFGSGLLTFEADPATHRVDASHRWGLSMYHYESAYYVDLLDAMEAAVAGAVHPLVTVGASDLRPPAAIDRLAAPDEQPSAGAPPASSAPTRAWPERAVRRALRRLKRH